jgi:small multidrug resistance pump
MSWFMLALAIASEVIATTSLKYAEGFTRLWPSVITSIGYVAAFALLSQALKEVPVSTAYAIWSGVGTATVAVIGIMFLGEPGGMLKTIGIAVIILGVILLNLGSGTDERREPPTLNMPKEVLAPEGYTEGLFNRPLSLCTRSVQVPGGRTF